MKDPLIGALGRKTDQNVMNNNLWQRAEYKTVTLKNKYDIKKKANNRITVLYDQ